MSNYDKVSSANPGAILEVSWGQATATAATTINHVRETRTINQPSMLSRAETSTDGYYDDDDSINDEPLAMTSWGSQQQQSQQVFDDNNNDQQATHDWNSLVDPNFTIKAGGVGSGQLHRKGGNYIPVPELAIVNQRLRKPIPSSNTSLGMLGSNVTVKMKKKKKRSRKKRERVQSMPVFAVPEMTVNGWGSGQLTSTPFWEQQQVEQYQHNQEEQSNNIDNNDDMDNIEIVPLLKIEIELAPGVTIPMTIFKGATMMSLVSDICRHHRLNMTQEAMESLCTTLDLLIQAKYP